MTATRKTRDKGYTLLELLVVLGILALVAAIAAPQMIKYARHSEAAGATTGVATVAAGLRLFRADVGRYPTTSEGLIALWRAPPGLASWHGPYVRNPQQLKDPQGRSFIYHNGEDGSSFALEVDNGAPSQADGRQVRLP